MSNYFDSLIRGVGKRGSTFADIDAITHDGDTDRFLVQEFKREGEKLGTGQRLLLRALSMLPRVTVWLVVKRNDGQIDLYERNVGWKRLSEDQYRIKVSRWWKVQIQEVAA